MFSAEILSDQDYCYHQGEPVTYPFKDTINLNLKLGGSMSRNLPVAVGLGLGLGTFSREIDMGFDNSRLRSLGDISDSNSASEIQSPSPYVVFDSIVSSRHNSEVSEPPDIRRMVCPIDHMLEENTELLDGYYPELEIIPITKANYGNNFSFTPDNDHNIMCMSGATSYGQEANEYSFTHNHEVKPVLPSVNHTYQDLFSGHENLTDKLIKTFPRPNLDKKTANIHCSHCDGEFKSFLELSSHIDIYKLIRSHKCPALDCPYNLIGFDKKALLRHHIISHHFSKGFLLPEFNQYASKIHSLIYRCSDNKCGKCFYRRDSLSRHTKLVHNNKFSKFNRKMEKERQNSKGKRRYES